ncbi:MAG: LpxL/LpxP family acyltransferase [Arsenophonus sp. NEOnobi-MAG3]
MIKVSQAKILPLFLVYNYKIHQLHIYIPEPMLDVEQQSNYYIASRMNKELEYLVKFYLAQYTWILKLLKLAKPVR